MHAFKLVALALLATFVAADRADAQTAPASRLEGQVPERAPIVSIEQVHGSVLDALDAIARQAGWNLVVTAPESATSRPLAIRITKRPATEALDLVLDAGGLRATLADNTLKVRPDAVATPRGPERDRRQGWEPRAGRGRHRWADRVVMGRSLDIGPDEVVSKAVAVGGSVTVLGHVRGDAVAVGGTVTLRPGARVEGDAIAIGGTVILEEGAVLEGDNVSLAGTVPAIIGSVTRSAVERRGYFRPIWGVGARLARGVLVLGIALLVVAAFPGHVTRVKAFLASRPALSSLGGLAVFVGFMPLCVLLAVTIIGIPLIPVAALLLLTVLLFGATVSAMWLGERVPLLREGKTPLRAVAIGGAILLVIGMIPWIGTLAVLAAALIAAGAALLSRFGRGIEVTA